MGYNSEYFSSLEFFLLIIGAVGSCMLQLNISLIWFCFFAKRATVHTAG